MQNNLIYPLLAAEVNYGDKARDGVLLCLSCLFRFAQLYFAFHWWYIMLRFCNTFHPFLLLFVVLLCFVLCFSLNLCREGTVAIIRAIGDNEGPLDVVRLENTTLAGMEFEAASEAEAVLSTRKRWVEVSHSVGIRSPQRSP